MAGVYPLQTIPETQKNEKWYKENVDYFIEQSAFWSGDRWEMIMLYQAAIGEIDKSAYKYVLNPYNSTDENLRNYPAQMRNYDIITPILNLFTGEKADKPLTHQVIVTNADAPSKYKDALDKAFQSTIAQGFVNALNGAGHNTGVPSQEVPEFDKLKEGYETNWNDDRALFGQEAIDYLKYHLNLKDKYQEAFWDWLAIGRVYTYKEVYMDDVIHEIVPPIELWHGTSSTGFIEDSNWAVRRTRYNLNDCIDRFREVLTKDEVIELEEKFRHGNEVTSATFMTSPNIDKIASSSTNSANTVNPSGLIDVYHVNWKTHKQIFILTYIDADTGKQEEMEVDSSYKLDKEHGDISLKEEWVNEVRQGFRLGTYLYKYLEPINAQRTELANTSKCKLQYNGRIGYKERDRIQSIVKMLLPYQALINIYHFRTELILAKNKEKLMLMPIGLKPANWAEDKWLHFADTTGMAWFDETKPNAQLVLNAIKSIDLSLGTYVQEMRNLITSIKQEAWEAVGMNRQRYGDVMASDGKGNNEQAVVKSSTISREMFRRFERFQETDLQGLLDLSKLAWINGKKGMYINSDGRKAFLEVNPEQHLESEYQVFVLDSDSEMKKLETGRQYAFGMAQKGGEKTSTVLEIISANNMSKLKDLVKKAEALQSEMEQKNAQAEQAHEQHLEQLAQEGKDKDNQTKIQVAEINAHAAITGASIKATNDTETDTPEVEDLDSKYNESIKEHKQQDLEKQLQALQSMKDTADRRYKEVKLALEQKNTEIKEKALAKRTKTS